MESGASLVGLEKAKKKIMDVANKPFSKLVQDAFLASAEKMRDEIKNRTPEGKTGNLRKSIHAEPYTRGVGAFVAADFKVAPHCYLVEYGHGGPNPAPAQPYFRPGAKVSRSRARRRVITGLKKEFKRV